MVLEYLPTLGLFGKLHLGINVGVHIPAPWILWVIVPFIVIKTHVPFIVMFFNKVPDIPEVHKLWLSFAGWWEKLAYHYHKSSMFN